MMNVAVKPDPWIMAHVADKETRLSDNPKAACNKKAQSLDLDHLTEHQNELRNLKGILNGTRFYASPKLSFFYQNSIQQFKIHQN